ncbi:MAG: hypothetical protein ACM339_02575 [Ignavibacteria bacterium]
MKYIKRSLALLIFFFINIKAQGINDIIPVVNLTAGKTDSILISDLFYSKSYFPVFIQNDNIQVSFIPAANYIKLTPSENFKGLGLVEFAMGDETYQIPFFFKKKN